MLRVSQDLDPGTRVSIPLGSGIAGAVAQSGESIRIDDAYADPRFNPEIDQQTGFRTQSILCLPIRDHSGRVFAVSQLLNRQDGQPFDDGDEARFGEFVDSLGVIFEALHRLHAGHSEDGRKL